MNFAGKSKILKVLITRVIAVVNLNNNMNSVDSDNLLQQLIYFRNSIFTSRFKALLNAYNGDRVRNIWQFTWFNFNFRL